MLKIYIRDLAGYNLGKIRGRFITLPMEEKELEASIKEILKYGDEYFITDYEFKDVELFKVEEFSSPYELNRKIALMEESIKPIIRAVISLRTCSSLTFLQACAAVISLHCGGMMSTLIPIRSGSINAPMMA